ncbi:hypothetical protein A2272_05790 [Candidatus Peregrinibacteria bacterium RIFOXYA12_FULL_33_12]|nr:MAG: hypothetical protein A2272_05790 [Candidatus Peregrinibacteria bacterium RIFOXYA12_FULL_33_12]OGJ44484.1 MAG: hypothetical protein A2263_00380 [Candidatus Peregrinibacteria bacterium RIFOXYA2_FULL_33_21]OGJ50234.1 MAG: hypothetical protein A2307_06635 [Candidatus Peregrinibacteria bacterium RIFOXYB2_FULL_33_20]
MLDLQKHERFEMEILKLMSDNNFLNPIIFGGGTCLRLCFGLNRYSVDLDFFQKNKFPNNYFEKFKKILAENYEITDFWEKHFAFLIEIRSPKYLRRLKIEMRKEIENNIETELNIAYSPFSDTQVRLTTFTLKQMWLNKIHAFTDRKKIRDAYDLEFLLKKDRNFINLISNEQKLKMIKKLDSFKKMDFKITLGSILEKSERDFYNENGFKLLKTSLI